jgi:hypothetical protein
MATGAAPAGASAVGLDGSSNLVCAANNVVACTQGARCVQGEASTFDLPAFIFVNFKTKVVHARTEGDAKQVESPIRNFQKSNTQLILQGIENGHGWGISIDQKGGRMTTTVSGESSNFMIFGACTAL